MEFQSIPPMDKEIGRAPAAAATSSNSLLLDRVRSLNSTLDSRPREPAVPAFLSGSQQMAGANAGGETNSRPNSERTGALTDQTIGFEPATPRDIGGKATAPADPSVSTSAFPKNPTFSGPPAVLPAFRVARLPQAPTDPAQQPAVGNPNQTTAQLPAADQSTLRTRVGEIGPQSDGAIKGKVEIFIDDETGDLIFIGSEEDVAAAEQKFMELSSADVTGQRIPRRIPLLYADSEAVVEDLQQLYDENYAGSRGKAMIKALKSPNSLLVFGSPEAIEGVRDLVGSMEAQPDNAEANFQSFALKHISAVDAKQRLDIFFGQLNTSGNENGLPPEAVVTIADFRSNVLVVRGAPEFLRQARLLLNSIDIDESAEATDSVRVFKLKNTVASDLATILQDAINGQLPGTVPGINPNNQNGQNQGGFDSQTDPERSQLRSSRLQLRTIDENGKVIDSGLLFDVRITPDTASNSLIVRGPTSAMELIEELIKQLDRLPDAETQIKVFQIVNGDAEELLAMLEQIFGASDTGQAGGGGGGFGNNQTSTTQLPLQTASATAGSAIVDLRFAVDFRTNSIIATGPAGDLRVVEDLLNRLDESNGSRQRTVVYRLSNSPVLDVEESLNLWLTERSDRLANDPRSRAGTVLANENIVVVPEVVSNSLIISALPENFPELERVIQALDRRPPMVKVKVLIAEVDLNAVEEFGVEIGLQDSLLFDRGTIVNAANQITGGIGFPFNSNAAANSNATAAGRLASQSLTSFGVGRTNAEVGYGGLVLSAGNDSINLLLRALKDRNCLKVLSKPYIMSLENLQGRVSVGQSVPRITSSNQNALGGGVSNSVQDVSVGVILEVTPRVSPDGMIVMFINAIKSSLGSEAQGVPVAVDAQGNVVRQAPINATEAQTTIMARSGQTVVFSGLIQETKQHQERGTPILSDLPLIGPLFKFETDTAVRSELLIIMTPYLVDGDDDLDTQNQDEMERMHWCLTDVAEVYGNTDYDVFDDPDDGVETYYPDQDPAGLSTDLERTEVTFETVSLNDESMMPRVSTSPDEFTPVLRTNDIEDPAVESGLHRLKQKLRRR